MNNADELRSTKIDRIRDSLFIIKMLFAVFMFTSFLMLVHSWVPEAGFDSIKLYGITLVIFLLFYITFSNAYFLQIELNIKKISDEQFKAGLTAARNISIENGIQKLAHILDSEYRLEPYSKIITK